MFKDDPGGRAPIVGAQDGSSGPEAARGPSPRRRHGSTTSASERTCRKPSAVAASRVAIAGFACVPRALAGSPADRAYLVASIRCQNW
jgi:hypothetical protein